MRRWRQAAIFMLCLLLLGGCKKKPLDDEEMLQAGQNELSGEEAGNPEAEDEGKSEDEATDVMRDWLGMTEDVPVANGGGTEPKEGETEGESKKAPAMTLEEQEAFLQANGTTLSNFLMAYYWGVEAVTCTGPLTALRPYLEEGYYKELYASAEILDSLRADRSLAELNTIEPGEYVYILSYTGEAFGYLDAGAYKELYGEPDRSICFSVEESTQTELRDVSGGLDVTYEVYTMSDEYQLRIARDNLGVAFLYGIEFLDGLITNIEEVKEE